jgi:predicted PurR-regulated permease PerM
MQLMTDSQKWLVLATIAAVGWLLYLLAPALTPFLFSALLAYLGDPLVDRLERLGLSRVLGVTIVFAVMLVLGIGALLVLVPALERQIAVVIAKTPQAIDWLQTWLLPRLSRQFGVALSVDTESLKQALIAHWQELGTVMQQVVMHLGRSSQMLLGWVSFLLLVPVVTFYLLRDWDVLVRQVTALLPRRVAPRVTNIAAEIDAVLAEFLRGQLTVMTVLAVVYVTGLWLTGLDLAFAVGIVAGLVSFVPYLGVIVGVLLAGIAALLQFGDVWHLVAVIGVFGLGQLLEGMVLSPLLVGDRIGLHPVAVIFAVMAGGQLFGFFGVLLALPVAAAIVVLLRHSHDEYLRSEFYDDSPPPAAE